MSDRIYFDDFGRWVPLEAIGAEGETGKWQVCRGVYGSRTGTVLRAEKGMDLPPIRLDLGLEGWHEVTIGIVPLIKYNLLASKYREMEKLDGLQARLSDERHFIHLLPNNDQQHHQELHFVRADLSGRALEIINFRHPVQIDYVACRRMPEREVTEYLDATGKTSAKEVAGINDFNDVADLHAPLNEEAWASTMMHAEAGFTTNYHKCYAVRCEYQSNVEERVLPDGKPVGRLVTRYDPLPAVAEASQKAGIKTLGWMRISNEFGQGPPTCRPKRCRTISPIS